MKIENLSLSFGNQDIFKNINLNIKKNEKVGIVGVNGAGKSTFFKIITKEIEPDIGKVIIGNSRVQLLPQVIKDEIPSLNITVFDYLLSARPLKELEIKLQKTYELIASTTDLKKQKSLFKKVDKIQGLMDYWNCYTAESELLKIIYGMSIDDDILNRKLSELSGGQKRKVAFARLLYSMPEIILLDEPTNHLDKETKDFITNYLKNYKGSVYVISHDVPFLNEITTHILYLDKRTKNMELYEGNYDRFLTLHQEREENINKMAKAQEKEIEQLQNIISKYSSASGKRKKMVQDREKKLEKLLKNKIDYVQKQKHAKVEMFLSKESSNIPLKANSLNFKYTKEKNIINNLSFNLSKNEKFLVIGENGCGKSTLLKLITGYLKPDSGEIIIGNNTDIGYYAQEHELLEDNKTILENFEDIDISNNKLRNVLGRFLFYGDDVLKKISVLSLGERSRVSLAKLSLKGSNLLILDEPTNHLDPETMDVIADTFKMFNGTMMIVSHNVDFLDKLGIDKILILPSGKILYYDRKLVEHYQEINNKK